MKNRFTALIMGAALALGVLVSDPATAQAWRATATNPLINAVATTTTGDAVDTSTATSACVHFSSASTSTATGEVLISGGGAGYMSVISTTDPTSAGTMVCGPTGRSLKPKVTRSAGTLTAYVMTRSMSGDPLAVGGWRSIAVGAYSAAAIVGTSVTDSGLTAGRVPFASTGGLLADSSAFTFSAGTLSATTFTGAFTGGAITSSTLTSGRVPFAGASGLLGDASTFTFASGALAVGTSVATTRFLSTGTAPTVANVGADSCGTTAATIAGKDQAHVITVGATSGTECRVSFNVAFANAPVCVATGQTATDLHLVTTTTTVTITGTLTAAEKLYVHCLGY